MSSIEDLRRGVERYPAERYPVQHAIAQFHLGVALLDAGRADDAERALAGAVEGFDPDRLGTEYAKALNALGAALRDLGRSDEAAAAFAEAAGAFQRAGLPLEQGAATFNLGLVRGDVELLRSARELLDPEQAPAQASAAARELGSLLLLRGELEEAVAALESAVALAERAGAAAELGAAANALGLAQLARGLPADAAARFRDAAAAHPRTIRPAEHAMAKANLALAWERSGELERARLSALQALAVPGAPPPVTAQAQVVLGRLPPGRDDLFALLEAGAADSSAALVREEVLRWLDTPAGDEPVAWARGLLARPESAVAFAEAWVEVLLELPREPFEALLARTFEPLEPAERSRLRSTVDLAAARFHTPQLLRLTAALDRWS